MKKVILVAGATGDLGGRISKELIKKGAYVKALVRSGSDRSKVTALQQAGAEIVTADLTDVAELTTACQGASCVVSALAGLHEVIVTAQSHLLRAAVAAGVPRFIPSDFCTDLTQLHTGDNRNFDLRKEFHNILDASDIRATSIFNGAFAHVLKYGTPLLDTRQRTITYYTGKKDWAVDLTTIDDTAAFTALAALDDTTPRFLRIAGFRVSPQQLADLTEEVFGTRFELKEQGSLDEFFGYIQHMRRQHPEGENKLYPQWQQMQYLYSMFAAHHQTLDNDRYPGMTWHTATETLQEISNTQHA